MDGIGITREFSFVSAVFKHERPPALGVMLERWVGGGFASDCFTEDVSSKGVKACAVLHDTGVQHLDSIVGRLRTVHSTLASL